MNYAWRGLLVLAAVMAAAGSVDAQNVSDYESIPNPYLLLLREPAVIEQLALSASQRAKLQQLNDQIDEPLLQLRNQNTPAAAKQLAELNRKTQEQLATLLDDQQQARFAQIRLRVTGIRSILQPSVAEHLKLTDTQQTNIAQHLQATQDELTSLREQASAGGDGKALQQKSIKVRTDGQLNVLNEITPEQKQQFVRLLGREIDFSQLGRVRFKAPTIRDSTQWVNGRIDSANDLAGQVVVLHFFAFG